MTQVKNTISTVIAFKATEWGFSQISVWMLPGSVSLEKSLVVICYSIILLTPLSWTFQNFHYSDSMTMKNHFPSGSDGITPAMNFTHVYILMYTLAVVTQVCLIKDCFVMHFYWWAELIPYFWEFELNILNTLLHSGIIQISREQIKNGKFPHLVLSLYPCRHLQSWNAYIHNIRFWILS